MYIPGNNIEYLDGPCQLLWLDALFLGGNDVLKRKGQHLDWIKG